jgi:hypothetical protein
VESENISPNRYVTKKTYFATLLAGHYS